MNRPSPLRGVAAAAAWVALAAALTPILLPASPLYRTVVVATGVCLFASGLVAPRRSWPLALAVLGVAGVSSLLFGESEPVLAASIPLALFLAGSALRGIYDLDAPPLVSTLLPLWRAAAGVAAVSAAAAWIWGRTWYLIARGVPPPRVVNGAGADVSQLVAAAAATLAAILLAAGFHAAACRTGRDARGQRTLDAALATLALIAGTVAVLQRVSLLPHVRAERWAAWNRAQSTFTDPSAAGVVAALLLAPLLARAVTGPKALRAASAGGVVGLLVLLADSGSRAGFLGAVVSVVVLVLWAGTRLAVGDRPGLRRRVALVAGTMGALSAAAFAAALLLPGSGARPALVARLGALLEGGPTQGGGERLVLYQAAGLIAQDHPLSGGGLGTFRFRLPDVVTSRLGRPAPAADYPPSLFLGLLAEMGLAGALLAVVFGAALVPALGGALSFQESRAEEALRAAGAAAGLLGLSLVFLFGSQLVYPEVAVVCGVLTARLPSREDARSARLVDSVLPVTLAACLALAAGGLVARAIETAGPEAAFAHSPTAGVHAIELEPGRRPFRWTGAAASFRVDAPADRRSLVVLPVKNARPAGDRIDLAVLWNDRAVLTVPLRPEEWRELTLPVSGPGVLRIVPSTSFRPVSRSDRRRLGIEVGPALSVRTAGAP